MAESSGNINSLLSSIRDIVDENKRTLYNLNEENGKKNEEHSSVRLKDMTPSNLELNIKDQIKVSHKISTPVQKKTEKEKLSKNTALTKKTDSEIPRISKFGQRTRTINDGIGDINNAIRSLKINLKDDNIDTITCSSKDKENTVSTSVETVKNNHASRRKPLTVKSTIQPSTKPDDITENKASRMGKRNVRPLITTTTWTRSRTPDGFKITDLVLDVSEDSESVNKDEVSTVENMESVELAVTTNVERRNRREVRLRRLEEIKQRRRGEKSPVSIKQSRPRISKDNGTKTPRSRHQSESSVEVIPGFIEEHKVITELVKTTPIENEGMTGKQPAGPSSSEQLLGKWLHRNGKRRIIIEKCLECEDRDSPPEIEVRIRRRSKSCRRYQTEKDIPHDVQLSLTVPDSPRLLDEHGSEPALETEVPERAKSPSEFEIERLSKRLQELKQEVKNVIRDAEKNKFPMNSSEPDLEEDSYKSSHNQEHISTKQEYHPKFEEESRDENMRLSAHSPISEEAISQDGQLEMSVDSATDCEVTEVQFQAKNYQTTQLCSGSEDEYESECDIEHPEKKREEQLLTPPPKDITLKGNSLYDPFHIGTTYVVLSRQNHGRFNYDTPVDSNNDSSPATSSKLEHPTPLAANSYFKPVKSSPVPTPVIETGPKRNLYKPKSLNSSIRSISSRTDMDVSDLDHSGTSPSSQASVYSVDAPPPIPARTGRKMDLNQKRNFNRPSKEPPFRELAVDAPSPVPPVVPPRNNSISKQINPVSKQYHLQTVLDVATPAPLDTWSGALPPVHRAQERRAPEPRSRSSNNSLRRSMPQLKLLGSEWKELAQSLGYENSQIASFAKDYPDPGQALLDHWSRQPNSRLDALLENLKRLDLWKTAETLDKTFDNTNV